MSSSPIVFSSYNIAQVVLILLALSAVIALPLAFGRKRDDDDSGKS